VKQHTEISQLSRVITRSCTYIADSDCASHLHLLSAPDLKDAAAACPAASTAAAAADATEWSTCLTNPSDKQSHRNNNRTTI